MFLRINTGKVPFVTPILNGEPLLVRLDNMIEGNREEIINDVTHNINTIHIQFSVYIESTYGTDKEYSGDIGDMITGVTADLTTLDADGVILSEKKAYSTIAIMILKDEIVKEFNLIDSDLEEMSAPSWSEDEVIYPIRITFPTDELLSTYVDYVAGEQDNPREKTMDGYTLYVKEILPEHDFIRSDENLLIEEISIA